MQNLTSNDIKSFNNIDSNNINLSINQSKSSELEQEQKRDGLIDGLVDTESNQRELENLKSKSNDTTCGDKNNDLVPKSNKHMSKEELTKIVLEEMQQEETLPYYYLDDNDPVNFRKLEIAINYLLSLEMYKTEKQRDCFHFSALSLFAEALSEMLTRKDVMILNTSHVTYAKVYEKLTKYIKVFRNGNGEIEVINLVDIQSNVIDDYEKSVKNQKIHNPLKYMMSCIWTGLQVGDITVHSQIKRDFG